MRFVLGWALAGVTVASSGVAGQSPAHAPWTTETINSRVLGKRTIFIATPSGYGAGNAKYPVVIMLDADDDIQYGLWIAQAAYLADNTPGLPQVIAVGIGNGSDRLHDMLPPATGSSTAKFLTAGGDSVFADYIVGEVLPYIRGRYRTLPTAILAGHSAGGLFALDVAAHRPTAFHGVVAMSPSLWYNDSTLIATYARMIAAAPVRPRVFVSSGGLEKDIDPTSQHFAETLAQAVPAGTFEYRRYPDLWHSMTPTSFSDGLRFIFQQVQARSLPLELVDLDHADSTAIATALNTSEQTFASAARVLALPERLPESIVNRLGYNLLDKRRPGLAAWILARNVKNYPESANVYDSYADALLAIGDTSSAVKNIRMSIDVAKRSGAPVAPETQAKLTALTARR